MLYEPCLSSSSGSLAAGVSLISRKNCPWLIWKSQPVMNFHLLEMILDEEISVARMSLKNRLSAVTCVVRCQRAEESPANNARYK